MSSQTLISEFFTPDIQKQADELVAKYETKRASILEILHLVQKHCGHISL